MGAPYSATGTEDEPVRKVPLRGAGLVAMVDAPPDRTLGEVHDDEEGNEEDKHPRRLFVCDWRQETVRRTPRTLEQHALVVRSVGH